jgi:hypothetical protein
MLVLNPADDREFEAFVASVHDPAAGWDALEHGLRRRYPQAIVRPRDLSGERVSVWYVYRDGHWIPSRPRPKSDGDDGRGPVVPPTREPR